MLFFFFFFAFMLLLLLLLFFPTRDELVKISPAVLFSPVHDQRWHAQFAFMHPRCPKLGGLVADKNSILLERKREGKVEIDVQEEIPRISSLSPPPHLFPRMLSLFLFPFATTSTTNQIANTISSRSTAPTQQKGIDLRSKKSYLINWIQPACVI